MLTGQARVRRRRRVRHARGGPEARAGLERARRSDAGAVRRLLRRCLEKDRKRRLDIGDAARLEIDEAIDSSGGGAALRRYRKRSRAACGRSARRRCWRSPRSPFRPRGTSADAVPEPVVTRLDVVTPPTSDAFSLALSHDGTAVGVCRQRRKRLTAVAAAARPGAGRSRSRGPKAQTIRSGRRMAARSAFLPTAN